MGWSLLGLRNNSFSVFWVLFYFLVWQKGTSMVLSISPCWRESIILCIPGLSKEMEMNEDFSRDVEDEANFYFARLYNQASPTLSVPELLDMLKRFKESSLEPERVSVFKCFIVWQWLKVGSEMSGSGIRLFDMYSIRKWLMSESLKSCAVFQNPQFVLLTQHLACGNLGGIQKKYFHIWKFTKT